MTRFQPWLTLIFALCLAACGAKGAVSDGTGYSLMHPSSATRVFILGNDRPFAREVAAHNAQCRNDKGCRK